MRNVWAGSFGDVYTKRNLSAAYGRNNFWRSFIARHEITSALEVGCNVGTNLLDLDIRVAGVDVNRLALEQVPEGIPVWFADATELPFFDNEWDLVFTLGVLIHIEPQDLEQAMSEIVRVADRFVFCGEYLGDDEIPYHGEKLWRRDYGALYEERGLEVVEKGSLIGEGWDRSEITWWLFHVA